MSSENPYQSAAPAATNTSSDAFKIAKGFRYVNDESTKDIIFSGAVFATSEALYISHDSHARQSSQTAMAAFGLLGMAINHLINRKKSFEYPFPELPIDAVSTAIRDRMPGHKFKKKTVIAVIPKDQVGVFSSRFIGGKKFQIGELELLLVSPVKKGLKELESLGYEIEE